MIKKILLLIIVAFVFVCYANPMFALPFGSYTGTIGKGDSKIEVSLKFNFNGKAEYKVGKSENDFYYKVEDKQVILSLDDNFDDTDLRLDLNSMYQIEDISDYKLTNNIGKWTTLGIGIAAIVLILLPEKKKK